MLRAGWSAGLGVAWWCSGISAFAQRGCSRGMERHDCWHATPVSSPLAIVLQAIRFMAALRDRLLDPATRFQWDQVQPGRWSCSTEYLAGLYLPAPTRLHGRHAGVLPTGCKPPSHVTPPCNVPLPQTAWNEVIVPFLWGVGEEPPLRYRLLPARSFFGGVGEWG